MIRLTLAPEPAHFDADVRQPGLRALDERVGIPVVRTAGKPYTVKAPRKEDLKGTDSPLTGQKHFPTY